MKEALAPESTNINMFCFPTMPWRRMVWRAFGFDGAAKGARSIKSSSEEVELPDDEWLSSSSI
jgi:hypothetical protein